MPSLLSSCLSWSYSCACFSRTSLRLNFFRKSSAKEDLPMPDSPQTMMVKVVVALVYANCCKLLLVRDFRRSSLPLLTVLLCLLTSSDVEQKSSLLSTNLIGLDCRCRCCFACYSILGFALFLRLAFSSFWIYEFRS